LRKTRTWRFEILNPPRGGVDQIVPARPTCVSRCRVKALGDDAD